MRASILFPLANAASRPANLRERAERARREAFAFATTARNLARTPGFDAAWSSLFHYVRAAVRHGRRSLALARAASRLETPAPARVPGATRTRFNLEFQVTGETVRVLTFNAAGELISGIETSFGTAVPDYHVTRHGAAFQALEFLAHELAAEIAKGGK